MIMETLALFAYALYLAIIVIGGFVAVTNPNLVRALVGLVAAMFGVAGMYFLMNAPFVGLMQLLIYVGAISVLIFFAIMLTRPPAGGEEQAPSTAQAHGRPGGGRARGAPGRDLLQGLQADRGRAR
jgi:NADH-quinone oxidoreductase subunit J